MAEAIDSTKWETSVDDVGNRVRRRRGAGSAPPSAKPAATAGGSAPKTHAAADAIAAERGISFPESVKTVKAKAAYLGF